MSSTQPTATETARSKASQRRLLQARAARDKAELERKWLAIRAKLAQDRYEAECALIEARYSERLALLHEEDRSKMQKWVDNEVAETKAQDQPEKGIASTGLAIIKAVKRASQPAPTGDRLLLTTKFTNCVAATDKTERLKYLQSPDLVTDVVEKLTEPFKLSLSVQPGLTVMEEEYVPGDMKLPDSGQHEGMDDVASLVTDYNQQVMNTEEEVRSLVTGQKILNDSRQSEPWQNLLGAVVSDISINQ